MGVGLSGFWVRDRLGGGRVWCVVALFLLVQPSGACGQSALRRDAREPVYSVGVGPLRQTLDLIRNYYVDAVDVDSLYRVVVREQPPKDTAVGVSSQALTDEEQRIQRVLEQLDPHSYYLTRAEAEDRRRGFEGKFYGIGVSFQVFKDTVRVVQVLPHGPASKVGMRVGDNILSVNGHRLSGVGARTSDVMHTIRGDKGSRVAVRVLRVRDTLEFKMKRDELPLNTVDSYYMLTPTVGYLHCASFGFSTRGEIVKALQSLEKQGMRSLIIDLSDNGGGVMNTAVSVCSDFLKEGQAVMSVRGMSYPVTVFSAPYTGKYSELPMVVVVNELSSSASEIMAGAMQDWDRAVLVGARTFGKGLVQGVFPLENGGELSLTVARYYTPSGRSIQAPYELGHAKEYRDAFARRYASGLSDTLGGANQKGTYAYKTLVNGRTVYGGGGVEPDVVVLRDTTKTMSPRVVGYERKGYMQHWVVGYVTACRKGYLRRYPTVERYAEGYRVQDSTLATFRRSMEALDGGTRDTVPYSEEERRHLRVRIKAYVGEQLYGEGAFMRVVNGEREDLARALEILGDWGTRGRAILGRTQRVEGRNR